MPNIVFAIEWAYMFLLGIDYDPDDNILGIYLGPIRIRIGGEELL